MAEFVIIVVWMGGVEQDLHLGAVRQIRAEHTADMIKQHDIATGLAGLRRAEHNSIHSGICPVRQVLGNGLGREVLERLILRHHGHADLAHELPEECPSTTAHLVPGIEVTPVLIHLRQSIEVKQSHWAEQFELGHNHVTAYRGTRLGNTGIFVERAIEDRDSGRIHSPTCGETGRGWAQLTHRRLQDGLNLAL